MAEQALVQAARGGDQQAFTALYDQHKRQVTATIRRLVRNAEDCDDLVNQTFANAFCRLHQFRGDSRFSTWLTRIGINCARMFHRGDKSGRTVSLDEVLEGIGHEFDTEAMHYVPYAGQITRRLAARDKSLDMTPERLDLSRAIGNLPDGYRRQFISKHVLGMEHKEIAARDGRTDGNSKSQVSKSRQALRRSLGR